MSLYLQEGKRPHYHTIVRPNRYARYGNSGVTLGNLKLPTDRCVNLNHKLGSNASGNLRNLMQARTKAEKVIDML